MSRKFYRLLADPAATTRWYLQAPVDRSGNEIDPRLFTQGVEVDAQPALQLPIRQDGDVVDFNLCDFDMVVTPAAVNAELQSLVGSSVQRIPVTIDSDASFEILNACDLVECVDESRTLFTKWTEADGCPEKVGQYRMIVRLKIDPSAADGHHLFRVSGWPIALIASEEVKRLLEARGVSGIKYEPVD